MYPVMLMHSCGSCGGREERVFTDSRTGLELCLMCLSEVAAQTTMSPSEDGDNLKELSKFQRPAGGTWSRDNYPEPR